MSGRRDRASSLGPELLCYFKRSRDSLVLHHDHISRLLVRGQEDGVGEVDHWGPLEVFTSLSFSETILNTYTTLPQDLDNIFTSLDH